MRVLRLSYVTDWSFFSAFSAEEPDLLTDLISHFLSSGFLVSSYFSIVSMRVSLSASTSLLHHLLSISRNNDDTIYRSRQMNRILTTQAFLSISFTLQLYYRPRRVLDSTVPSE